MVACSFDFKKLDPKEQDKLLKDLKKAFDELTPAEKNKLEKKSFALTPKLTKEARHLLTLMGLPYVDAPGEAEAQCAAFEKSNITNGISTEDWDALFFGCNKIYKNFSNKCDVIEIDRKILSDLAVNDPVAFKKIVDESKVLK